MKSINHFRLCGGEISIPTEKSNENLKKDLVNQVASGIYSIGELVVPQKFEKMQMKDGEIKVSFCCCKSQ